MRKMRISLENCYGIKKLIHSFDFSELKAYAIYAPNGSMKTSFAQVFQDISEGQDSRDRIFPSRTTTREIKDENSTDLPPENVLVIQPYVKVTHPTAQASTLLVNERLRLEYERLLESIEQRKATFLKAMKEKSGSKKALDQEISLAFMLEDNAFFSALERVKTEIKEQEGAPFDNVKYDVIFDERAVEALDKPEVKSSIQDYITQYNKLLDASAYFKRGVFEYYNASQIATTLNKNGFFEAKHSVFFNAEERREIRTQKQLTELIQKELDAITENESLKKRFATVKKHLEKNAQLRKLHQYLCENPLLLPHLSNITLFKQTVWKSYFKANESLYDDLLKKYREISKLMKKIEHRAKAERTQWEEVIDLFNERFFVPFKLVAKNREDVMLGNERILHLGYIYFDGPDKAAVEGDKLIESLSQGEKKALYILDIIFEIEARKKNNQKTLFIVDDIADSFDYKNKYAIIQYLQEISEGPVFKQIILTHNFDFFRTVESRFVGYKACLMATRKGDVTKLSQAEGIRNPFLNDWKNHLFDNGRKRVASISFARNLIEHTQGVDNAHYSKLTSLLHWMRGSLKVTQKDLNKIYSDVFNIQGNFGRDDEPVVSLIEKEAKACLNGNGTGSLAGKVVLSIAIRLEAEKFMVDKIADDEFVRRITTNQTTSLLKRFEGDFQDQTDAIRILRKVVLMTPENIHLNAFMYEPLVDMSDESLKSLYREIRDLK